uniref:AF4/FMR2 C-terminal homology domain-containing protein n=1 Tax=Astyanax mexicanus TaxID=7994 RepID=A0A8B9LW36_ASTMX
MSALINLYIFLRRREWERRNQEAQQDRELFQESTPLFGEPYKTNKGDELSRFVQRMLGNYEDENNSQYIQYDGAMKDRPSAQHVRSGRPSHKDKTDPSFQNLSSYGTAQPGHPGHGSGQPLKKFPFPHGSSVSHSKEEHSESHQQKMDTWSDMRDYSTLPPILPDLSPPAGPLSPLHSSESGDSNQDMDNENEHNHSLSPEYTGSSNRREPLHHLEPQKEVPQLTGDAPPLVSQTFPLPLSSKPNLANSKKPMALVRPMDGPDQVTSESPDLKPSPEDFHGQSYESLPDLKNGSKPSLPPLKVPAQSVEVISTLLHCVKLEMASWPPLLTAIHTPSTAEPSKFSFPIVCVCLTLFLSVCLSLSLSVCLYVFLYFCGSSQEEDRKDISWLLGPFIKKSQPKPNPQNHSEIGPDLESVLNTKPQLRTPPPEETKPRTKRCHTSRTPPAQVQPADAASEAKSTGPNTGHKPTPKPTESGHRKTVGNKQPGRSSKAPRPEEAHSSLQVESVEVTPRDKDSTFTDRPKVKTKSAHEKSSVKKSRSKHTHSNKKEGKDSSAPPRTTLVVESSKPASPSPAAPRSTSPPPKSTSTTETPTPTPTKSSKKSRPRSPSREKKSQGVSRSHPDPPQTLLVKIELSQLSRVPQLPKPTKTSKTSKTSKSSKSVSSKSKTSLEKELGSTGKPSKKRPVSSLLFFLCKEKRCWEGLDKTGKALRYLDAVLSFVESGIAMESDPQTPKSAYTMFSETLDLIRLLIFNLDFNAVSSFALLQMAMFRCKRESALKYSRTLTEHFKVPDQITGTPSPMSPMPSPASSVSSGLGSNPISSSITVAIPQVIQQVASSYVNITALFLSAHDTWEQAEEIARRGSGTLTSGMTPLVRYTRQGLHWLKLDASDSR